MARGETLESCFQIITLLQRRRGVSAVEAAEHLGVSRRTAYRYLNAASLVLPVWTKGAQPKRYKFLNEGDFAE